MHGMADRLARPWRGSRNNGIPVHDRGSPVALVEEETLNGRGCTADGEVSVALGIHFNREAQTLECFTLGHVDSVTSPEIQPDVPPFSYADQECSMLALE